jgi:hypothetical protein
MIVAARLTASDMRASSCIHKLEGTRKMTNSGRTALVGVVSLIVGLLIGGGYGMKQVDEAKTQLAATTQERDQAVQNTDRMRKLNDDAAKKYGRELGKLVMSASTPSTTASAPAAAAAPAAGQPDAALAAPSADDMKAIDSARALLATRDGFRGSLDALRAGMDSEMDAIAIELGASPPSGSKIRQLLDSLKQNWPNKENNLEIATRKLMADLGLMVAPGTPKPAGAPVTPAPAPADKK